MTTSTPNYDLDKRPVARPDMPELPSDMPERLIHWVDAWKRDGVFDLLPLPRGEEDNMGFSDETIETFTEPLRAWEVAYAEYAERFSNWSDQETYWDGSTHALTLPEVNRLFKKGWGFGNIDSILDHRGDIVLVVQVKWMPWETAEKRTALRELTERLGDDKPESEEDMETMMRDLIISALRSRASQMQSSPFGAGIGVRMSGNPFNTY